MLGTFATVAAREALAALSFGWGIMGVGTSVVDFELVARELVVPDCWSFVAPLFEPYVEELDPVLEEFWF